jgi:hypothetical protein
VFNVQHVVAIKSNISKWAKKVVGAAGGIAGLVTGPTAMATLATGGAEIGATAGAIAGPIGVIVGGIAGGFSGGLAGAGVGLVAGVKVGQLVDKHVLHNAHCLNPDCGKNSPLIGDLLTPEFLPCSYAFYTRSAASGHSSP